MNSRQRVNTAIQLKQPDRVPMWCLLSLGHIVNHGMQEGRIPETIEELVEAECRLACDYHFDGSLIYFPGMRKGAEVGDLIRKSIETLPEGDAANDFETADPQNWPIDLHVYQTEDYYSSFLTRQILGENMHIGGWAADGFSRAIQWFPTFDEAMMASVLDPVKFRALVDYFDHESIA